MRLFFVIPVAPLLRATYGYICIFAMSPVLYLHLNEKTHNVLCYTLSS